MTLNRVDKYFACLGSSVGRTALLTSVATTVSVGVGTLISISAGVAPPSVPLVLGASAVGGFVGGAAKQAFDNLVWNCSY